MSLILIAIAGGLLYFLYQFNKKKEEMEDMEGMAKKFYTSTPGTVREDKRLKEISNDLGKNIEGNNTKEEMTDDFINDLISEEDKNNVDDLVEYIKEKDDTSKVMEKEGISKKDLKEAYHSLVRFGAGQWVNGHFVAASALAYPSSLKMVFDDGFQNEPKLLVHSLVQFFQA